MTTKIMENKFTKNTIIFNLWNIEGDLPLHIFLKGIIKNIGELQKHLKVYEEYHGKLGSALSTTVNHYNASGKEFKKIDKDIMRITGETLGIESLTLERPDTGD